MKGQEYVCAEGEKGVFFKMADKTTERLLIPLKGEEDSSVAAR